MDPLAPSSNEAFPIYQKNWIEWVPIVLPAFVILIAALVLIGGRFDVTAAPNAANDFASMKPGTAAGFIISAISILLIQFCKQSELKYASSKITSLIVIGLACCVLFEFFFHKNNEFSRFLRMEPISAVNFLLLGLALLSVTRGPVKNHPLSHLLAFAIGIIALLPLIGFLYRSHFTLGLAPYCEMAPNTALCFLLIAVALSLHRIDHDLAAVLISDGPGGGLARRILPFVFFVPLFLGWLRVQGESHGLVSVEFGTAFFTTVTIAALFIVVWIQSVALERNEMGRRKAQSEKDMLSFENQLREQFVAMLSHDLRNPLTVANSYAELIIRSADASSLSKSNAQKILQSLSRSEKMIQNLLDVSLIRSGQPLHLSKVDCDLSPILSDMIQDWNAINKNRLILKSERELKGNYDSDGIRRALENLCANAIKYGAADSPVTVQARRVGDLICLSVHNYGKVISPEQKEILFEPFQRGNDPGAKGWGLGLALVRGIAEAHGGRVSVESEKETGTTFTIELPGLKSMSERS